MDKLSAERFLEIVEHKEICEFCPDIMNENKCINCKKVKGISYEELRAYHKQVMELAVRLLWEREADKDA